jgi:hypothetical protein
MSWLSPYDRQEVHVAIFVARDADIGTGARAAARSRPLHVVGL